MTDERYEELKAWASEKGIEGLLSLLPILKAVSYCYEQEHMAVSSSEH
jgi:hypothetical protein